MHEVGILFQVVRSVESFAIKNGVTRIDTLVLQVGELSPVVPHYLEACYPAAVDGTLLQETKLKIEVLPGTARCRACGKVWRLLESPQACPHCGAEGAENTEILGGREFMIKEIVAM